MVVIRDTMLISCTQQVGIYSSKWPLNTENNQPRIRIKIYSRSVCGYQFCNCTVLHYRVILSSKERFTLFFKARLSISLIALRKINCVASFFGKLTLGVSRQINHLTGILGSSYEV